MTTAQRDDVTPLWALGEATFTPVARQLSRLLRADKNTGEEFDAVTYLVEVLLKCETTVAIAVLSQFDKKEAEQLGFQLVNSDGLGTWADVLPKALTALTASAKSDYLHYTRAFTAKFSLHSNEYSYWDRAREIWSELNDEEFFQAKTRLGLLQFFVALRNRTRGHGATTQSQYEAINPNAMSVANWLLDSSPFIKEDFLRPLKVKTGGLYACRVLRGYPTQEQTIIPESQVSISNAIYFRSPQGPIALPDFIRYTRDDDSCYLLNSKRRAGGSSEFLDYVTNRKLFEPVASFAIKPADKPSSVTAGRDVLDMDATPANNLPVVNFMSYVPRPKLEEEILAYLLGGAVNFVSLRGPGGAGKTTLALRAAREIINASENSASAFDFIFWFSARDVDLDEAAGPLLRKRQVTSLSTCAELFLKLLDGLYEKNAAESAVAAFGRILATGREKFLLIFDNFESFDDVPELQQFVKKNLAHPSKALITSRENQFQGDVPIEVSGLSRSEAADLVRKTSRVAYCEPRIDERIINKIFDATLGNPYSIKLLVHEFARVGDIDVVLQRSATEDFISALFRRSFERLDNGPAYLFLLITQSQLGRDERFAHLMCAGRRIDYNVAKQSVLDAHLLDPPDRQGEVTTFRVSWAAVQFASRFIIGHRMQREVEQDKQLLTDIAESGLTDKPLSNVYEYITSRIYGTKELDLKERDAEIQGWLRENDADSALTAAMQVRYSVGTSVERDRAILKNAAELNPTNHLLWLNWSSFEREAGDFARAADLLVRSIDFADGENQIYVAARMLLGIMSEPEFKIRVAASKRGIYTRNFIYRLENLRPEIAAQTLTTLGYLYLNSGDLAQAHAAAEEALQKDSNYVPARELLRKKQ